MTLIPIRSEGSRPPLFVASQLAGTGRLANSIADALGPDHPVYTFERLHHGGKYVNDLDVMARMHADELEQAGFEGPFHLTGYSFGAQLAFALAHHLRQRGKEIGLLAIIDDGADVHRRKFNIENASRDFTSPQVAGRYAVDRVVRRKYPGKITLFRAERWFRERQLDSACEWQYLAEGGVDILDFPCSHSEITTLPFLASWADHVAAEINGEPPRTRPRHVPSQTDRVPETALSAFAKAKHGDLDGEIHDYKLALQVCPDAPAWIRINLAMALENAGAMDEAIAVLSQAVARADRITNAHVSLLKILKRSGRREDVRALAQSARELDAETPSDLQIRGVFFQICNMIGESQKSYLKALEIEPSWTGCRVPCAKTMLAKGQYKAFKDLIDEGLERTPDQPNLLILLADYHALTGTPETAETILGDLIANTPMAWRAHTALINLLNRQGRSADAVERAEAALALDPPHGPTLEAIGRAYLTAGRDEAAADLFRKAINRDESFLPSWIGLTHALEALGQPEKAIALMRGMPQQHREKDAVTRRAGEIVLNGPLQFR